MRESIQSIRIETVVIPPDGGWGWFVVFVAFSWNIIVDGTAFIFACFLNEMIDDFKVAQSLLMLASSVQMGLYYLLGPMVAAMINRVGFRPVAICGGLIAFAGVLSSAFVKDIYVFIVTFGCVLGLSFSMTYMCNILVVGFYFEKYRAVATCLAVTGSALGVSIFPFVHVLLPNTPWRDKYKYISGAHLLMAIMGSVYKPVPPSEVITTKKPTTENSSIWEDWEREHQTKGNLEYPTNAQVLENIDYTVITPYDDAISKSSIRSTKTIKAIKSHIPYSNTAPFPKYQRRKCCCCICKCTYLPCPCLWHDTRPMYRDDILYLGSTKNLKKLKGVDSTAIKTTVAATNYNMSVTRIADQADIPRNADCCNCCPDSVTRVLSNMLDCSLIKSGSFLLLAFSGFITFIGFYAPYIYGIQFSLENGVDTSLASYILTTIGISNGVGRIVSGVVVTTCPKLNAMLVSIVTIVCAGIGVICHAFFRSFVAHVICSCVFGFGIATISSLRTIVVVDLLGLEKLTNAFGIIVLLEGLSSLLAMPLNALIYETFNDLRVPFFFSGTMIIISGLMLIPVKPLHDYELKRAEAKNEKLRNQRYLDAAKVATTSTKRQRP